MANKLIGRERERKELEELYHSDRPIFAVIYGRRRVGKTYLVRQMLRSNLPFVIRDCLRLNYLQKRLLTNSSGLFTVVLFNMAVN